MGLLQAMQFLTVFVMAVATIGFTSAYLALATDITNGIKSKGMVISTNILVIIILLGIMLAFFVYILKI